MPAEDEAVQMAIRTCTETIQTVQALIRMILTSLEQAKRARGGQDGIIKSAAKKGTHLVANKIDGLGDEGIVSARKLRAENPDGYGQLKIMSGSPDENKEQIKLLKKELAKQGIGFSVLKAMNPETKKAETVIGIQGRDLDIITQSLINIGVKNYDMNRDELEHIGDPIERTEKGLYPPTFDRAGLTWNWEKDEQGRNTWVGTSGAHSREKFVVTLDQNNLNKATFQCIRNGTDVIDPIEVDATKAAQAWSVSEDGTKEFYNEMLDKSGICPAAPDMPLEAAIDRGCFVYRNNKDLTKEQKNEADKDATLMQEVATGKPAAASPDSPMGKATAATQRVREAEGKKPKPTSPEKNQGPHR